MLNYKEIEITSGRKWFKFEEDANFIVYKPITISPLPIHGRKDQTWVETENIFQISHQLWLMRIPIH